MEFISTLCGILCFLCILATPITLIVWLVLLITKNEKKKKAKYVFLSTLGCIVLFTIIGVATFQECEHNWETIVKTAATCTENGSTAKICTLCDSEEAGEEIPATGHTWTETVKEATCTEQGERTKKCSTCGETTYEVLELHHNYTETITKKPSCESEGKMRLTCSACGDKQDKSIPATGHNWGEKKTITKPKCQKEGKTQRVCTKCKKKNEEPIAATGHSWNDATCTAAKTCSICNEKEGKPIGHTTEAGICSRCNEIVKKQSPVTIIGMKYTKDYVGGVEWTFKIKNNSDKEIKYVTLQWNCYNAVGDLIYDEISWKSYVRVRYTGPLSPGKTSGKKCNSTKFYNHSFASIKWSEITVEYMDGTTETIDQYYKNYYKK